jgi:hypothetical protein
MVFTGIHYNLVSALILVPRGILLGFQFASVCSAARPHKKICLALDVYTAEAQNCIGRRTEATFHAWEAFLYHMLQALAFTTCPNIFY